MKQDVIIPNIFKKYYIELDDIFSVLRGIKDQQEILPEGIHNEQLFKNHIAIVDVQGRDSFAASVLGFQEYGVKEVSPVIVYNQVQYGDWYALLNNVKLLKRVIDKRYGGVVHQPIVIGDPDYWRILNGRYVSEIIRKFGFYSPCLNCHLCIHSMRAFLAKALGCSTIISGERESHDGRYKINQLPVSIDCYSELLKNFGIVHINPVRYMVNEREIKNIVQMDWKEGANQPKCVFSSNYINSDGTTQFEVLRIEKFFKQFGIPIVMKFFEIRLEIADNKEVYRQLNEYIRTSIFN